MMTAVLIWKKPQGGDGQVKQRNPGDPDAEHRFDAP